MDAVIALDVDNDGTCSESEFTSLMTAFPVVCEAFCGALRVPHGLQTRMDRLRELVPPATFDFRFLYHLLIAIGSAKRASGSTVITRDEFQGHVLEEVVLDGASPHLREGVVGEQRSTNMLPTLAFVNSKAGRHARARTRSRRVIGCWGWGWRSASS